MFDTFTIIKQEIILAPVLKYYNPKKLTVLQTNPSAKGLGVYFFYNVNIHAILVVKH